jgi:hypothetical protein
VADAPLPANRLQQACPHDRTAPQLDGKPCCQSALIGDAGFFWDRLVLPIKHARERYQLRLTRNLILTK